MNVLLTGASGFIGSHLARALRAAGYVVIEARRDIGAVTAAVQADFTRDLSARDWLPKLAGVDAVINAVGILREHGAANLRAHSQARTASAVHGVRRRRRAADRADFRARRGSRRDTLFPEQARGGRLSRDAAAGLDDRAARDGLRPRRLERALVRDARASAARAAAGARRATPAADPHRRSHRSPGAHPRRGDDESHAHRAGRSAVAQPARAARRRCAQRCIWVRRASCRYRCRSCASAHASPA